MNNKYETSDDYTNDHINEIIGEYMTYITEAEQIANIKFNNIINGIEDSMEKLSIMNKKHEMNNITLQFLKKLQEIK